MTRAGDIGSPDGTFYLPVVAAPAGRSNDREAPADVAGSLGEGSAEAGPKLYQTVHGGQGDPKALLGAVALRWLRDFQEHLVPIVVVDRVRRCLRGRRRR
jgi:hypothetical protein